MKGLALSVLLFYSYAGFATVVPPNAVTTPGILCTKDDPNFKGYDYPERVVRCNRNISTAEKFEVAATYGNIPQSEWPNYEFDHLIPLCAGGSNDPKNLWPQPIDEAKKKDVLENQICIEMRAGTLTQAEAVAKIRGWFLATYSPAEDEAGPVEEATPGHGVCETLDGIKIRFAIAGPNTVSGLTINVKTYNGGDRVAIQLNTDLPGTPVDEVKNPSQKGMIDYAIVEKADNNRFELILLPGIQSLQKEFTGFLKVGFEENTFPTYSPLRCNHN
jgi:hypothetical protein